jgi:hypothetical protein
VIELRVARRDHHYFTAEAWHAGKRLKVATWPTEALALQQLGIGGALAHNVYRRDFPKGYRLEIRRAADSAEGVAAGGGGCGCGSGSDDSGGIRR